MKYEWRKAEKEFYFPKKIEQITIPAFNFITLEGAGNPNDSDFTEKITALYNVAYGIRMPLKNGVFGTPFEYTVYPLEGIWTTSDGSHNETLNKSALLYKIMIRQPDQVTPEIFETCFQQVQSKKENPNFKAIHFERYADEKVVQAIHRGPFDTEGETFAAMQQFMNQHNLKKTTIMGSYQHREIYISDLRRSKPENLKTTLRYRIQ